MLYSYLLSATGNPRDEKVASSVAAATNESAVATAKTNATAAQEGTESLPGPPPVSPLILRETA
jgi:hypothetical protein